MAVVARHRDAPGERGAGDGEVAQPFLDEGDDLVAPAFRLDEIGVGLDMGQKCLLILAHPEEV